MQNDSTAHVFGLDAKKAHHLITIVSLVYPDIQIAVFNSKGLIARTVQDAFFLGEDESETKVDVTFTAKHYISKFINLTIEEMSKWR